MFTALLFSQQLNNLNSLLFWGSLKKTRLATSRLGVGSNGLMVACGCGWV